MTGVQTCALPISNSVGTMAEILGAARQAFAFAKPSDQDWIFGKTALTLYPALAK